MRLIICLLLCVSGCVRYTNRFGKTTFVTDIESERRGLLKVTKCDLVINDVTMEFHFRKCKYNYVSVMPGANEDL